MKKLLSIAAALLLISQQADAQTTSLNVTVPSTGGTPFLFSTGPGSIPYSATSIFGLGGQNQLDVDSSHRLTVTVANTPGGAVLGPLGPSTAPNAAVSITDTGVPITGVSLGTGGQGLIGWLSQLVNNVGLGYDSTANASRVISGSNVAPTNCSGTVTSGNSAVTPIGASSTIHGFTIANIDAAAGSGEPLWISFTGTAAAQTVGSFPLAPPVSTTFAGMGQYTTPVGFGSSHAVSAVAATSGHKFSCIFW